VLELSIGELANTCQKIFLTLLKQNTGEISGLRFLIN